MKKMYLYLLVIATSSGCALQPWTAEDQARLELASGGKSCPAFFDCYDLSAAEKLNAAPLHLD